MPFTYEGGIEAFMENEVLSYAPDAFVDEKKTTVGYEISFTKYFYKPVELREMSDILISLTTLESEADGMLAEIMGECGLATVRRRKLILQIQVCRDDAKSQFAGRIT